MIVDICDGAIVDISDGVIVVTVMVIVVMVIVVMLVIILASIFPIGPMVRTKCPSGYLDLVFQ